MSRCLLLSAALLVAATAAPAQQQSRAHMEACVEWTVANGRIGTRNSCSKPITVLFMAHGDTRTVPGDVPPGGWFDSGATFASAPDGFMFTVCPVGYLPSVRFSPENKAPIVESLYNCLPGRPNA
jgi:hypothetical protein